MKRTFLHLAVFVASLAGPVVLGGTVRCEAEDGSTEMCAEGTEECTNLYESPCVAESQCDYEDCDNEDGDYWYDTQTGEYCDLVFSDESEIEEMVLEETAESKVAERADTADDRLAEADLSILVEDVATEQMRSRVAVDEYAYEDEYCCDIYDCEGYDCAYDEWWHERSYKERVAMAESSGNTVGNEEGELGSDEELECWMDAEIDQMIAASQQHAEQIGRRKAILSLARTLDQVSATLQAISRHLADVAASEVAELPAGIDEPIER